MKSVTNEYREEMKRPIRSVIRADVTITAPNYDGDIPKLQIASIVQKKSSDPISRKLPVNELTLSAIDFDQSISNHPCWSTPGILVDIVFVQELQNGGECALEPRDRYFFDKVFNKGNFTEIKATGIINRFSAIESWGLCGELNFGTELDMLEQNISHYAPEYLPFIPFFHIDPYYKGNQNYSTSPAKTISESFQYIANAMGAIILTNGKSVTIKECDLSRKQSAISEILSFRQVLKGGISHQVLPKISSLVFAKDEDLVNVEAPTPEISITYNGNETAVDGRLGDIRDEQSGELLDNLGIDYIDYYRKTIVPSVEEVPAMQQFVGHKLTVIGFEIPTAKIREPIFINEGGVEEEIYNPYSTREIMSTVLANYYRFRNILKVKYRGNPAIEPGDKLLYEYAPDKKIPCLVVSNTTNYAGTVSGEITLKILLTDDEIETLRSGGSLPPDLPDLGTT